MDGCKKNTTHKQFYINEYKISSCSRFVLSPICHIAYCKNVQQIQIVLETNPIRVIETDFFPKHQVQK